MDKETRDEGQAFDVIAFANYLLKHWYYIVISLFISGVMAFLVVRYAVPVYQASGQLLLNMDMQEDPLAELTQQGVIGRGRSRMLNPDENDILVLKSSAVEQLANEKLNLQVRWYGEGRIRGINESDAREFPFSVHLGEDAQFGRYSIKLDDNSYALVPTDDEEIAPETIAYGKLNSFGFELQKKQGFEEPEQKKVILELRTLAYASSDLHASLNVASSQEESSVYKLTAKHEVKGYTKDYINALMEAFIEYSKTEKQKSFNEALVFVQNRLNEIGDSLKEVEQELTRFQVANKIVDITSKGQLLFTRYQEYVEEVIVTENQLKYVDKVGEYLKGITTAIELKAPVVVGLDNVVLNETLKKIQAITQDMAISGVDLKLNENNPAQIRYRAQLEELNSSLTEVTEQLKVELQTKLKQLTERKKAIENELGIFPALQQQMVNIKRRYEMFQNLYRYLSEKKLEIGIQGATVLSNHKVIEFASSVIQVAPNTKRIYALGLSLGTSLPMLILFLLFYFDNRLKSVEDIEQHTDITLISVIPQFHNFQVGEIFSAPKSLMAESFRNLRTNLNYLAKKGGSCKIVLITSTQPGEGKTFCSENLASILAFGRSKVVVIGADMRRPQLFKDMNLRNEAGLSEYLSGQRTFEDILLDTEHETLKVIVSGAIPPNPTELLDSDLMEELLTRLRQAFDYIIIDTTPLDIVADANTLVPKADYVLVVLRQNVSSKQALPMLNAKFKTGQLPKNTLLLLNDFDHKKSYGSKGYGYGYGYGYGQYGGY